MSENYQLVYQSRRKCEIYRHTGVSKNIAIFFKSNNYIAIAIIVVREKKRQKLILKNRTKKI